jgi:hypothetical protein
VLVYVAAVAGLLVTVSRVVVVVVVLENGSVCVCVFVDRSLCLYAADLICLFMHGVLVTVLLEVHVVGFGWM